MSISHNRVIITLLKTRGRRRAGLARHQIPGSGNPVPVPVENSQLSVARCAIYSEKDGFSNVAPVKQYPVTDFCGYSSVFILNTKGIFFVSEHDSIPSTSVKNFLSRKIYLSNFDCIK